MNPKAFRSRVSAGISENAAELEYKRESQEAYPPPSLSLLLLFPDIYAYKHNTLPFLVAGVVRVTHARNPVVNTRVHTRIRSFRIHTRTYTSLGISTSTIRVYFISAEATREEG